PLITTPQTDRTYSRLGVMEQIKLLAEGLTSSVDGILTQRGRTIDTQINLQERRIAQFDVQLESKRVSLERQFLAMEQALASLQTQQQALSALTNIG
ncbi:MAG: flagellar filament capping protein FliD, partial [Planctomycetota bacterium]|nr:flagellar filament capping protein FliD [Planctomycetota bacterium]